MRCRAARVPRQQIRKVADLALIERAETPET
jgi:hypothetical protein